MPTQSFLWDASVFATQPRRQHCLVVSSGPLHVCRSLEMRPKAFRRLWALVSSLAIAPLLLALSKTKTETLLCSLIHCRPHRRYVRLGLELARVFAASLACSFPAFIASLFCPRLICQKHCRKHDQHPRCNAQAADAYQSTVDLSISRAPIASGEGRGINRLCSRHEFDLAFVQSETAARVYLTLCAGASLPPALSTNMTNTIDQYREAKATYEKLHNQAKKELIARFNQLASELLQIQRELKDDFGHKLVIPTKGKPARPKPAAAAAPNPQVAILQRKVAVEKAKLEKAAAAGKPEKAIQDRIYELEDELRLSKEA